jgi:hypothetical protein
MGHIWGILGFTMMILCLGPNVPIKIGALDQVHTGVQNRVCSKSFNRPGSSEMDSSSTSRLLLKERIRLNQ